ncbi:hypothetical protein D3C81_1880870 [compost metagenome]
MPSPLSTREPLPELICRSLAVSSSPSISEALASSSAWVIRRAPLSSAMTARVTGPLDSGASFTPSICTVAVVQLRVPLPRRMA